MPIAAVIGTKAGAATGTSNAVTPSIDTTGCTLLVAVVGFSSASPSTITLSDSKSNVWQSLAIQNSGAPNFRGEQLFYCKNPTVGSGHNFTATTGGAAMSLSVAVEGFSGTDTSQNVDQSDSDVNSAGTTLAVGPITPTQNNELVVTGLGSIQTASVSIGGGFTIAQEQLTDGGFNHAAAVLAYIVQTTATSANPTWTVPSSNGLAATIASFKAPAMPDITTSSLSNGILGRYSSQTVSATGSPTSWSMTGAPTGWSISSSGVISGTPTQIGDFTITVTATNANGSDSATFSVSVTIDPNRFPDPNITGVLDYHWNALPRDWAGVTENFEYEDAGQDFNERTSNPPQFWEIQKIGGLEKARTDIFDAFWESQRLSQQFEFTDKYGATWQNVRIADYSRKHEGNKAWNKTVAFRLAQYRYRAPIPSAYAWLRMNDQGLADAATPTALYGHLIGHPSWTVASDGTTPTYETNEINGLPVVRLTDGHVSLDVSGSIFDIFLVMKVNEATFSAARGILSDFNNEWLIGSNGTTKFADLSLPNYEYRLNGTLYAANNQQAPMNTFGIVHLRKSDVSGFLLDDIFLLGQSGLGVAGNIDVAEVLIYNRLLSANEYAAVTANLASLYNL